MFSSLDRIDIVGNSDAGGKLYVQTDHRAHDEIENEIHLSVLFALTRILLVRHMAGESEFEIRYVLPTETPPTDLCRAVSAAGATLEVAEQAVALEASGASPYDLADAAMAGLARRVIEREGLSMDEEGLRTLELRAFEARPALEQDETGYWTLRMELAAVAGEILRRLGGGHWARDEHNLSMFPFAFLSGGDQIYNVFGRVERLFDRGLDEGPRRLLAIVADQATGGSSIMFSIKPGSFVRNEVLCRPLMSLPESGQDLDIPIVVYGEDRPNTFAHFPYNEESEARQEQYHAQALALLRSVEVEIHRVELADTLMLVVTGHYYAAEKILDPEFMRRMHEETGAELMLASLPRKGMMFLIDAASDDLGEFFHITDLKYTEQETGEPISTTPFLIQDGGIMGVARPETDNVDPRPEQSREKRAFFGKRFKKH